MSELQRACLLVDSTGLRRCGPGEWRATRRHRSWRRLNAGADAAIGQILASELTTSEADDGLQIEALLDQIAA